MSNPGSGPPSFALPVVGDDGYDAGALEEQRVNRAVGVSNVRALNAGHGPRAPKAQPTEWSFTVRGFPANDQQPLTFVVDEALLINSTDATVDQTVTPAIQESKKASVTVKIPALGFENTREYVAKDGVYVKYEFTPQGLSLGQQTNPF